MVDYFCGYNFQLKKAVSLDGILGGENHYDNQGRQVGYSIDGIFGGENHYNESGTCDGFSYDGLFGTNTSLNDDTGSIFDLNLFDD